MCRVRDKAIRRYIGLGMTLAIRVIEVSTGLGTEASGRGLGLTLAELACVAKRDVRNAQRLVIGL